MRRVGGGLRFGVGDEQIEEVGVGAVGGRVVTQEARAGP